MKSSITFLLLISLLSGSAGFAVPGKRILIEWNQKAVSGQIEIRYGKISALSVVKGKGKISSNSFQISGVDNARLVLDVAGEATAPGPETTVISLKTPEKAFSFLLRDVKSEFPIYIPAYGVVVLPGEDSRSYQEVEKDILSRKNLTKIQQIERQPETNYNQVKDNTRNMTVPIWLGIGRDMRMFEITEELQDMAQEGKIIRPKYSSSQVPLPELKNGNAAYLYVLGRGVGTQNNIVRRLENGVLPIYHSDMQDDDINYHSTSFVSFEKLPLNKQTNIGTNYIVSDKHSAGRSFKEEHKQQLDEKMKTAYDFKEGMVLYSRTSITNRGRVPRYAWIKTPRPGTAWWSKKVHTFDHKTGFSAYAPERIFCISKLNGAALPNEEVSILVQPGETVQYEFSIPHLPVSAERAEGIRNQSFDARLSEAKAYWNDKLLSAATIQVPEKRVDEMVRAGLLHLDLITFGEQPEGTLSANIGVYSPIGTESAPIIQYYLSMGWNDMARRALNYFLETQLRSGYIQNYEGYTIETGAALWSMGEYVRYTRDLDWLRSSKDKILKSCDYLLQWREKNKKSELKGRGFGMIDGKVADPEDHFHSFMLNGYAYLGLKRMAEVLKNVDEASAERISKEAELWKADIRETVTNSLAISPVVPLGDGTWVPTLPPWAEADAPRSLLLKKETYWSHATFTTADALLGPLYLVFCEVLPAESAEAKMMLDYHSELFYQGNTAFSQPYYDRHNWIQAKRGMVKPFLNTYYNTFAAHADRETYTFWEHMFRVSPHKTHEEAWFLMETRWMLYLEDGNVLRLLSTIPREWLANGKTIEVKGAQSYFGKLNLRVQSSIDQNFIEANIESDPGRKPEKVTIRIPHPEGKIPVRVTGGTFDPANETVTIASFNGKAAVRLDYE